MSFPDYYEILGIPLSSTPDQIKTAYRRASLRTHPDRIPPGPANDQRRKTATSEFQAVADAYYTLSDPSRRKSYDQLRSSQSSRGSTTSGGMPGGGGSWWGNFGGQEEEEEFENEQPDAEHVFADTFEDLLRPEVHRIVPLWTWTGAAAGAALGFIVGNIAGATIGAFGGSRLGAIRDAKGKAVYQVFTSLESSQKAQILQALAAKVFGMSGIADNFK
ncbi:J domain-containing protein [Sporobolomyces salmoneus]|uniref:J domain-containing protein n=1 Tax=Sporobolomyces salmoneus TaxID=183962 RepID=UPI00317FD4B2